jgi:hypothetical protein
MPCSLVRQFLGLRLCLPSLEQGVDMDGSELGDLAQVLSSTGQSSSD